MVRLVGSVAALVVHLVVYNHVGNHVAARHAATSHVEFSLADLPAALVDQVGDQVLEAIAQALTLIIHATQVSSLVVIPTADVAVDHVVAGLAEMLITCAHLAAHLTAFALTTVNQAWALANALEI